MMRYKEGCRLNNIAVDFFSGTGLHAEVVDVRNIHAHYHEDILEFIYCIKGSIFCVVAHEEWHLNEGDMVTVDQMDIKYISSDKENVTLIVHADMRESRIPIDVLRNTLISCTNIYLTEKNILYFENVCDKLLAAMYAKVIYDTGDYGRKNIDYDKFLSYCRQIRLSLIDVLEKRFSWFAVENMTEEDIRYRDRLRKIISFVEENSREKITVSGISKVIYLNPVYISSFLRRTSFGSFTLLLNYYRCLDAQKLLLETEISVGDISQKCGFSSEKYFYKYFKHWYGTTPLQYRKKFQKYAERKEEYHIYSPQETKTILKDVIAKRHMERAIFSGE